jgi:hypothetical protein
LLDPFTHFRIVDVLVPFASNYRTLWMSLGIITAELSIAIGASVLIRRWIGYRTWHVIHSLTYIVYAGALVHAIGTGTDTRMLWATLVYGGSLAAVAGVTLWRTAQVPALRNATRVIVVVFIAVVAVWGITGPYADGWAVASGTPQVLLDKAAGVVASPEPASTVAPPSPTLPQITNMLLSGDTRLSEDFRTVLLIGKTSGPEALDVAIQFPNQRSIANGQIQVREDANQTPLCAGSLQTSQGRTISATCSGYGKNCTLQITLQNLDRDSFTAVIESVTLQS